jgi:hypothetical protein
MGAPVINTTGLLIAYSPDCVSQSLRRHINVLHRILDANPDPRSELVTSHLALFDKASQWADIA